MGKEKDNADQVIPQYSNICALLLEFQPFIKDASYLVCSHIKEDKAGSPAAAVNDGDHPPQVVLGRTVQEGS